MILTALARSTQMVVFLGCRVLGLVAMLGMSGARVHDTDVWRVGVLTFACRHRFGLAERLCLHPCRLVMAASRKAVDRDVDGLRRHHGPQHATRCRKEERRTQLLDQRHSASAVDGVFVESQASHDLQALRALLGPSINLPLAAPLSFTALVVHPLPLTWTSSDFLANLTALDAHRGARLVHATYDLFYGQSLPGRGVFFGDWRRTQEFWPSGRGQVES